MRKGARKDDVDPDSEICFLQESGSFFVLDGEDEMWDGGKVWRHMSKMCAGSKLTFAFMFRQVQATTVVSENDSTLVDPPQQSDDRERRFQEGKKLWDDPNKKAYYKAAVDDIDNTFADFFKRHS